MTDRATLAWNVAAGVVDPELADLTIADLGILRGTDERDGTVVVTVTPTFSGCPAMTEMRRDLLRRLGDAGLGPVEIRTTLSPPWTSDWITAEGRAKLAAAGISPPARSSERAPTPASEPVPVTLVATSRRVACPRCGSGDTAELSHFGATACRSLYRCRACREPFEHMREI